MFSKVCVLYLSTFLMELSNIFKLGDDYGTRLAMELPGSTKQSLYSINSNYFSLVPLDDESI